MPNVTQQITKMLNAVTANASSEAFVFPPRTPGRAHQATVAGTGALTADISWQGSLDGSNWIELGTTSLAGNDSVTGGIPSDASWPFERAVLTNLTGTGATLTASVAI